MLEWKRHKFIFFSPFLSLKKKKNKYRSIPRFTSGNRGYRKAKASNRATKAKWSLEKSASKEEKQRTKQNFQTFQILKKIRLGSITAGEMIFSIGRKTANESNLRVRLHLVFIIFISRVLSLVYFHRCCQKVFVGGFISLSNFGSP